MKQLKRIDPHTCPNYNLFYDKKIASMKRDLSMYQMFGIIIFNYGIKLKNIH
jgi:hypothetical protein